MKKKVFLICSVISLLLVAFPVSVCADETTPNTSSGSEGAVIPLLDSYFYDNYDILPYIEADGNQYINTGIVGSSSLEINFVASDFVDLDSASQYVFGSLDTNPNSNRLFLNYVFSDGLINFAFGNGNRSSSFSFAPYSLYNFLIDQNNLYINNSLLPSPAFVEFSSSASIAIFCVHSGSTFSNNSAYKLYKFSIYDKSLDENDEPIGYVRYYYPAKAKTSGSIGLYDAVSKTFFPSLGSEPFSSPTDDQVIGFQIGGFVGSGLTWIGDILDFVLETPILLFFMSIGLAGVAFRWTKRILHF